MKRLLIGGLAALAIGLAGHLWPEPTHHSRRVGMDDGVGVGTGTAGTPCLASEAHQWAEDPADGSRYALWCPPPAFVWIPVVRHNHQSEPMKMAPTEMAGVAEAETQAAYAWALDYDGDEFPTQPTQRLTPRRITALALAASLVLIAVAGAVVLRWPMTPISLSHKHLHHQSLTQSLRRHRLRQ